MWALHLTVGQDTWTPRRTGEGASCGGLSFKRLHNPVSVGVLSCPCAPFSSSATCVRKRMDKERFSTLTLELASLPTRVAAWTGGAAPAGLVKGNAYSTTLRSVCPSLWDPGDTSCCPGSGSSRAETRNSPRAPQPPRSPPPVIPPPTLGCRRVVRATNVSRTCPKRDSKRKRGSFLHLPGGEPSAT